MAGRYERFSTSWQPHGGLVREISHLLLGSPAWRTGTSRFVFQRSMGGDFFILFPALIFGRKW
jgi:hypothetical protein